jgi:hypothetical protein
MPKLSAIEEEITIELRRPSPQVKISIDLEGPSSAGDMRGRSILLRKAGSVEARFSMPASGEFKARFYGRNADEALPPASIPDHEFGNLIIPELESLIRDKKASEREKELFLEAFERDGETRRYYYLEDRLNPARAAFVLGVLRKTSQRTNWYGSVLELDLNCVRPSAGASFPIQYSEYYERSDFRLIEPIAGLLQAGKEYHFVVDCPSAPEVAIIQGSKWIRLKRNERTLFEASLTTEAGLPIHLSIPKNDGKYWAVVEYAVGQ